VSGGRRKLSVMKTATERKWAERVRAWRASGQGAEAFAEGKGYAGATLRWWSSRLGRDAEVRLVPLVARRAAPVEGESRTGVAANVVVEVGGARLRVGRGFDPGLLADVVHALASGGQR
jgi:hypothetical protein